MILEDFENTLAGARKGDRASLQKLIEWYWSNLHRFVSMRLRDPDQTDDLLQDFLIDLVRRDVVSRFRGGAPVELRSFLLSCLQTFMKGRYKALLSESVRLEDVGDSERLWISFAVSSSVEDEYVRNEDVATIHEAIMRLRLDYRRIVQLHLDGYTHAEIGAILNIPRNTVSSSVSRAKEELRNFLSQRGLRP